VWCFCSFFGCVFFAIGYHLLLFDCALSAIDYHLLLFDCALSAIDYHLLLFDCALSAIGYHLLLFDCALSGLLGVLQDCDKENASAVKIASTLKVHAIGAATFLQKSKRHFKKYKEKTIHLAVCFYCVKA
jgi:hypothetical protein